MAINSIDKSKINKQILASRLAKNIFNLASYIVILIFNILIIYFAGLRGNPKSVVSLSWVALIINIVIIVYYITKKIYFRVGHINRTIDLLEFALDGAWLIVLAIQFFIANKEFDAVRYDMLYSIGGHFIAVGIITIISNAVDYFVNRRSVKRNFEYEATRLICKREQKKIRYQFVLFAIVIGIEVFAFLSPRISPNVVDDVLSENRALKYVYHDERTGRAAGYYVENIYYGLNTKVVIPKEYAGKPVVGIESNSIYDFGKIDSLQIGEYNEFGVLESNVKYIENNAIRLKNIKQIVVPESVEFMGYCAFNCENVATVDYYSGSALNFNSFTYTKIETLNLINERSVVDITYSDKDVAINVPTTLYNSYREKDYEHRENIDIADENFVIIDFDTDTDYYLQSVIIDGRNARLSIMDLKNENEETSALITDTLIYNANHYDCYGFTAKEGYALRGWYRDKEFKQEVTFDDNLVQLYSDTTIYAKWEKISYVKLNWNNYFPYDEMVTTINYIKSESDFESAKFPNLVDLDRKLERTGYKSLTWHDSKGSYVSTKDLRNREEETINLTAKWELMEPDVSYTTYINGLAEDGNNIEVDFEIGKKTRFYSSFYHECPDVSIVYKWSKIVDGKEVVLTKQTTKNKDEFNSLFELCNQSGTYNFEVIATSATGESSSKKMSYTITINKQKINAEAYGTIQPGSVTYDGGVQTYEYMHPVPVDIKVTTTYVINDKETLIGPINYVDGEYIVHYTFENIGEYKDNFEPCVVSTTLTINKKVVTPIWSDTNSFVYNGLEQDYLPRVNGICGEDDVSFIMATTPKIDVGEYSSVISKVDNSNYVFDPASNDKQKTWTITPATLTTNWGETNRAYAGTSTTLYLAIQGIKDRDKYNIVASDFGTDSTCTTQYNNDNDKLVFTADRVGSYNISVSAFNNSNYIFAATSTTLNISKSKLGIEWNTTSKTYTGYDLTATLTLTKFYDLDSTKYTEDNFRDKIIINSECSYKLKTNTNKKLVIEFSASQAGTYNISLDSVINDNYEIDSSSATTFTINPKTLLGSWSGLKTTYNGNNQAATYEIAGISKVDIANFAFGDFTVSNTGVNSTFYADTVNSKIKFNFYAKNAGTYEAEITDFNEAKFNNNYVLTSVNETYEIARRLLTVEWSGSEFEYNANVRTVTATPTNLASGDAITITSSNYTGNAYKDVGEYTAKLNINEANYYSNDTCDHTWTISKKTVTVSTPEKEFTYGGDYKIFNIRYTGFCPEDIFDIDYSDFNYSTTDSKIIYNNTGVVDNDLVVSYKAIDAKSSYGITLVDHNLSNYNINTLSYSFKINPLTLLNTWQYTNDYVYDGNNFTVVPNFTNLCTRADTLVTDVVNYSITNNVKKNAGNYSAMITEISSSNYSLPTNKSLNWAISKRTIEVSWNDPTFTYNASTQSKYATVTNICSGDNIEFIYTHKNQSSVLSGQPVDVGDYTVSISEISVGSENYKLPTETLQSDYTINPRKLTSTCVRNDSDYVGDYFSGFILTLSGFPTYNESLMFSVSTLNLNSNASNIHCDYNDNVVYYFQGYNVNTYNIKITGLTNDNYIIDTVDTSFTISPRALTISGAKADSIYSGNDYAGYAVTIGNFPTYDEANKFTYEKLDATNTADKVVKEIANSNTVVFKFYGKNAKTYTANITGTNNSNYTVAGISDSFTINKRTISVNWTEGSYVYDGTSKSFVATITNKCNNDSINIGYSYEGASNKAVPLSTNSATDAGEYIVRIASIDNTNYTMAGLSTDANDGVLAKKFTISKRMISLTETGLSFTYNGNYQAVEFSVNGYVDKDATMFNNDIFDYTHSGNKANYENKTLKLSSVNVGTYSFKINGFKASFDDSNYYFDSSSKFNQNYVINKYTVGLNWTSDSLTYNGNNQTITASLANEPFTNALTGTKDTVVLTTVNNVYKDAASYTANVTDISNSNYQLPTITNKSWTINKKVLTASFNRTSVTYNGQYQDFLCTIDGFVKNDDVINKTISSFTITSELKPYDIELGTTNLALKMRQVNANNDYKFTCTGIDDSNYSISINQSLVINKKTITLNWSSVTTFTYNGSSQGITCSPSGICTNVLTGVDSVSLTIEANNYVNAGSYTAKVIAVSNSNYAVPSTNTKVWTINKLALINSGWTYSTGVNSKTYDGLPATISLTISGLKDNDPIGFNVSNTNTDNSYNANRVGDSIVLSFNVTNANTYLFGVTGVNTDINKNYTLAGDQKSYEINKAKLNISWSKPNDFTYDGLEHNVVATVSGFQNNEASTSVVNGIKVTNTNFTSGGNTSSGNSYNINLKMLNAGAYTTVLSNGTTNYDFVEDSIKTQTVIVSKATLSINFTNASDFTYDGTTHTAIARITGFVNDEQSNDNVGSWIGTSSNEFNSVTPSTSSNTYSLSMTMRNVGTYKVSFTASSTCNYTFTAVSKEIKVSTKGISTSWENKDAETYSGENIVTKLYVNGIAESDFSVGMFNVSYNPTITYEGGKVVIAWSQRDAGSYTYKLASINNTNYSYALAASATKTINKKEVTLDFVTPVSTTYNGTYTAYEFLINGICDSDIASLSVNDFTYTDSYYKVEIPVIDKSGATPKFVYNVLTADSDTVQSKTYNFIINSFNNTNYSFTSENHHCMYYKKQLTVTCDVDENTEYDGSIHTATVTISGFVNGEEDDDNVVNSITKSFTHKYNNYVPTDITPTSITKANGSVIYTFKYSDIGTYSFTVSETYKNINYSVELTGKTQVITAKKLEYEWESGIGTSKVYDGTNSYVTLRIMNVYNNELEPSDFTINNSVDSYSYSDNALNIKFLVKDVNKYNFNVSELKNKYNYSFAAQSYSCEITKKVLTVSQSATTLTYNGSNQTVNVYMSGFVGNDAKKCVVNYNTDVDQSIYTADDDYIKITLSAINAGTYYLSVSSINNNNYSFNVNRNFTISKKSVSITAQAVANWLDSKVAGESANLIINGISSYDSSNYTVKIYSDINMTKEILDFTSIEDHDICYYKVTLVNLDNYSLSNPTGSFTVELTDE